jgi:Tol biopolymer transport system component
MRAFRLTTLLQLALTGAASFVGAFVAAATAQTQLVSVNRDGSGTANGGSVGSAFSADGRFMAFISTATDLLSNDTSGQNVYVRDLETGVTTLISADHAGTGGANGQCFNPVLSADGRFVAFESTATNLVANDTNGGLQGGHLSDVFLRDRQLGVTQLVSINLAGTDSGEGESTTPAISADGTVVAFNSRAKNLTANTPNPNPGLNQDALNVYARDLMAGTTQLVSVNMMLETALGDSAIYSAAAISADGRNVAFTSSAPDLVSNDTNGMGMQDVFVRDLQSNTTMLVSINRFGDTGTIHFNNRSEYPLISADGRFVVFTSYVPDLVTNDTNGSNGRRRDVFVRDLQQNQTALVSVGPSGDSGNNESFAMAMTPDARYVVFYSLATDLVDASDTNGQRDAFVRDVLNGTTTLLSVIPSGASTGNGNSLPLGISADGRFVTMHSDATDLVSDVTDGNDTFDVYVRDQQQGTTALVSVNVAGTGSGNSYSFAPLVRADGKLVAFSSIATDLTSLPDLNGGNGDVFVRPLTPNPQQALADLIALVQGMSLPHGLENSLTTKLENARQSLDADNLLAACGQIGAFVNQVEAQSGKKLTTEQADQLIASADSIRTTLGCS